MPDSGGYIGLFELYQAVYARVHATSDGRQEPVLTILQGVGPFPVALYLGASPDTLGPAPIKQTPPPGTAVEVVDRAVVQASGRGAEAFHIQAGHGVTIDQSRKLIDFGKETTFHGPVSFGDVAEGNIIKITFTSAAAADVRDERDLLGLIDQIRTDVDRLADAPKGKRQDTDDELRKAQEACRDGDRPRLLEKLDGAQKILLAVGGNVTAAMKIAEAIGAVLQRVMGLGR